MPESQWRWGEHGGLSDELGISYHQQNEIANKYLLNNDRASAAVKWLQDNQQMSWRVIVRALDAVEESKLADEVRKLLEPPSGEIIHIVVDTIFAAEVVYKYTQIIFSF